MMPVVSLCILTITRHSNDFLHLHVAQTKSVRHGHEAPQPTHHGHEASRPRLHVHEDSRSRLHGHEASAHRRQAALASSFTIFAMKRPDVADTKGSKRRASAAGARPADRG